MTLLIAFGILLLVVFLESNKADGTHLDLVSTLKQEEGLCLTPCKDSLGISTLGYGINLAKGITEAEATTLLIGRIHDARECLLRNWVPYDTALARVKDALADMGYQLGCRGVLSFKKMLAALTRKDYLAAQQLALSSSWARQTPNRAKRVTDRFMED